jgi:4-hydroxyphenylacetate 3-monooxygenase
MGARTGSEYVERLAARSPTVFVGGERLEGGIPEHPAFRNVVNTYAGLYDLQHAEPDTMTYESPTSGERVGMSFLVPRAHEDLVRRREMFKRWADRSLGTLGRTGDYLNSSLMAMSEAGAWFAQADPAYAENIRRYYELVREQDLLLTHTLIPPQANRSQGAGQQLGGQLTAHVVDRDAAGIVVRGARLLATIGPIADELLVFPSTVLRGGPEDEPYSFAFAIPCDAPGLRFICRETMDYGRGRFDHPLASRFEEMDAVVVFDDVHVPMERVFMLGHPELCNQLYLDTGAVVHMAHQVVTRTTAKTEFLLGLISCMTEAVGIEQFGHVQEDLAEVIVALETVRGLLRAAEADAAPNAFGVMTPKWDPLNAARNWYPRFYARLPAIVRKLGASGLMALPTEADVAGPARADVEAYLQSATLDGPERVRLFRLAWDISISAFAGRQELYEYYFFGDPVRMAGALVRGYDREPYKARVREFLEDA